MAISSGMYLMLKDVYPLIAQADDETDILLDSSVDPDVPTRKVLAIEDLESNTNNQLFIKFNDNDGIDELGYYDEPLTGDCLIEAEQYFDTTDTLIDSDELVLDDADDLQLESPQT